MPRAFALAAVVLLVVPACTEAPAVPDPEPGVVGTWTLRRTLALVPDPCASFERDEVERLTVVENAGAYAVMDGIYKLADIALDVGRSDTRATLLMPENWVTGGDIAHSVDVEYDLRIAADGSITGTAEAHLVDGLLRCDTRLTVAGAHTN